MDDNFVMVTQLVSKFTCCQHWVRMQSNWYSTGSAPILVTAESCDPFQLSGTTITPSPLLLEAQSLKIWISISRLRRSRVPNVESDIPFVGPCVENLPHIVEDGSNFALHIFEKLSSILVTNVFENSLQSCDSITNEP